MTCRDLAADRVTLVVMVVLLLATAVGLALLGERLFALLAAGAGLVALVVNVLERDEGAVVNSIVGYGQTTADEQTVFETMMAGIGRTRCH